MSCSSMMSKAQATLQENDSLAEAAAKLLSQDHARLPVVDTDGRYVGMFGVDDLLGIVVPRIALAGSVQSNVRFIGDDPDAAGRRFAAIKDRRVAEFADRSSPTLAPDEPGMAAIRHFCRSRTALPVVDKASGRLVGMLSHCDALRALIEPA